MAEFSVGEVQNSLLEKFRGRGLSFMIVSSIQAVLACLSGLIIMYSCSTDKINDRHWLVEPYGVFMTAYLYYDAWIMFETYEIQQPKLRGKTHRFKAFLRFLCEDPALMIHHLLLPVIFLPVILYFRRGLGDYILGFFLLIEAFIPFASFREILILLHKEHTSLYLINGLLTVITYTCCRILIFPAIFHSYGIQINKPFYQVPFHLPRVCNIGCAILLTLFLYWWKMVLTIAYGELKARFRHRKDRHMDIKESGNVMEEIVPDNNNILKNTKITFTEKKSQ